MDVVLMDKLVWEGNMAAPFPGLGKVERITKPTSYTFEYMPCDSSRWKPIWKRSKKRFETIDDAVRASGLWMQICFDNDWPIAVRLVEM